MLLFLFPLGPVFCGPSRAYTLNSFEKKQSSTTSIKSRAARYHAMKKVRGREREKMSEKECKIKKFKTNETIYNKWSKGEQ